MSCDFSSDPLLIIFDILFLFSFSLNRCYVFISHCVFFFCHCFFYHFFLQIKCSLYHKLNIIVPSISGFFTYDFPQISCKTNPTLPHIAPLPSPPASQLNTNMPAHNSNLSYAAAFNSYCSHIIGQWPKQGHILCSYCLVGLQSIRRTLSFMGCMGLVWS